MANESGHRAGFLDDIELRRMQRQLRLVLQRLIERYTQGESSSVPTETAESLLTSALYALDAYLLHVGPPRAALTALRTAGIADLYEKGIECVRRTFEEAKLLYTEIRKRKLDVPIEAYHATIDESLPVFMNNYGIVFDAHDTMAGIDYPLAIDDMKLQGVFYIKQYLERLRLENEFCIRFDRDEVLELLERFGSAARFDYRIELFNLFELVLHHALFSTMSGGDSDRILLSPSQYGRLERSFASANADEIARTVHRGMARLQEALRVDDRTADYMNLCGERLIPRLVDAAARGRLRALVLTVRERNITPDVIVMHAGDKMCDVRLRRLLEDIARRETKEGKVALIRANVFSLHDYLDLLESDCLYEEEYDALYSSFGDVELAILSKIVWYEELRGGSAPLREIVERSESSNLDWKRRFAFYMNGLNGARIRSIEGLIDSIDYEEVSFR